MTAPHSKTAPNILKNDGSERLAMSPVQRLMLSITGKTDAFCSHLSVFFSDLGIVGPQNHT